MTGAIYKIPIEGKPEGDEHPRVVVIGSPDSSQCLVVECYSKGGYRVEALIAELERAGRPRCITAVELDNSKHCRFNPGYPGREHVYWLIWRWQFFPTEIVAASKKIGDMYHSGLLAIVEGLLAQAKTMPQNFNSKTLKKLRKAHAELQARIASQASSIPSPPSPPTLPPRPDG